MMNYYSICSDKDFIEICTNTIELYIILNSRLQQLVSDTDSPEKLAFYGSVLEAAACVAFVRNVADEIRIAIFSNPLK
jgi:hypothetical protein